MLAPAQNPIDMQRIVVNDTVNATLTLMFMSLVVAMIGFGLRAAWRAHRAPLPTAQETPAMALPA